MYKKTRYILGGVVAAALSLSVMAPCAWAETTAANIVDSSTSAYSHDADNVEFPDVEYIDVPLIPAGFSIDMIKDHLSLLGFNNVDLKCQVEDGFVSGKNLHPETADADGIPDGKSIYGFQFEYTDTQNRSWTVVVSASQKNLYALPNFADDETRVKLMDDTHDTYGTNYYIDQVSAEYLNQVSDAALAIFKVAAETNDPTATLSYTLTNRSGEEAVDTAIEISKATFADGSAENVIIARADDFADAMSSTGLAGALDSPILLVDRQTGATDKLKSELARLGAKNVYVVGGWGAIPADIEGQLSGYNVQRVWGQEASDTSVKCAEKVQSITGIIQYAVVAMSDNFQDALSMSSFAYKYKAPIILMTSGETSADRWLPEGSDSLLTTVSDKIFVAGGRGAISDSSLYFLNATKKDLERIWGETGYDTSNQIATYMVNNKLLSAETAVVASGAQAPKGVDALAGAALAGKAGGVMLLANGQDDYEAIDDTTILGSDSRETKSFIHSNAGDIKDIVTLGGSAVMPRHTEQEIRLAMLQDVEHQHQWQTLSNEVKVSHPVWTQDLHYWMHDESFVDVFEVSEDDISAYVAKASASDDIWGVPNRNNWITTEDNGSYQDKSVIKTVTVKICQTCGELEQQ